MFEEMRTRELFNWMFCGMVLAAFVLVQFSSNIFLMDVGMQLMFYVVVPVSYFGSQFRKQKVPVTHVVFLKGASRWILPAISLVMLSMFFSIGILWLQLRMLAPIAPQMVDYLLKPASLPDNTAYLITVSLIVAVIGPIAEEFMFRGLLLKRLIVKTSMWEGVWLSSLLFGMLHMDFFGAFLFGVTASILYLLTDNLLIPILLHVFHNSLVVGLMYVSPGWPQWLTVAESADIYAKAVPNAIALLVSGTLLLAVILRLAQILNQKKEDEKYQAALKKEAEAIENETNNPETP
ncbi:CPBP family intramembrane glutamic endopeptidase [Planococcus shenhongbingii]|uniref:CPBP family intramembrane metalloprotease n=1 Tax=Planococcus shenhongbingii TaxID=3058398 RepID=A0ABT8NEM6_9BACL|nr:CPBP family intramembrane glutamic endopeptidase [Planococcus sp. N017]MDN7246218.1 CPBP family intramembrane metalloprotease [Planococcus sp. N017]